MQPPPFLEIINGEPEYEAEKILGEQLHGAQLEVLIKWKGFPQENNSWEPAEDILEHCQELALVRLQNSEAIKSMDGTEVLALVRLGALPGKALHCAKSSYVGC